MGTQGPIVLPAEDFDVTADGRVFSAHQLVDCCSSPPSTTPRSLFRAGTSTRAGSVIGRMTGTVLGVAPNGNLLIHGERTVRANKDFQVFRLRGEVRPRDVRAGLIEQLLGFF